MDFVEEVVRIFQDGTRAERMTIRDRFLRWEEQNK